jgi:serine protease AprX
MRLPCDKRHVQQSARVKRASDSRPNSRALFFALGRCADRAFTRRAQRSARAFEACMLGTNILESTVHQHRAELGRVRELAQSENKKSGEKPTVANMSWGTSVQQVALGNPAEPGLGAAAVNAPKGSPLHKELTKALGHAPTQRDIPAVSKMIAERMQKNIDDKVAGKGLREAKEKLGSELKEAAEKDKVHVVAAMGNQHEHATHGLGNDKWGASIIHDVPNHISVGASDLGNDPKKVGDERMSTFSSAGQVEVAAPGVQSPVGTPAKRGGDAAKWDGTSFASPYVAGTVALMLQANPNMTSQQIRETLQGTAHDIKGTTRDGAGIVDPVAAVRRARELAAAR